MQNLIPKWADLEVLAEEQRQQFIPNRLASNWILIIIITIVIITAEIYAVSKLLRYRIGIGAYNSKSFTYEINAYACMHTHTHSKRFAQRKMCQRNKGRRLETLLK